MNKSTFQGYWQRTFIICLLSMICFGAMAQIDSASSKNNSNNFEQSSKGNLYVSAGLGASIIQAEIYDGQGEHSYNAIGTSQSLVYNGTIDYGIARIITIGAGVAYQTSLGIPVGGEYNSATEEITRLNVSIRILWNMPFSKHFEIYGGLRTGSSFWTDKIISPEPQSSINHNPLTMTAPNFTRFSVQFPCGVRYFIGFIGAHLELGIGTPYFIEGGISFRIKTGKQ